MCKIFAPIKKPQKRAVSRLKDFQNSESAGGLVLFLTAALAILWANSPWAHSYQHFWHNRHLPSFAINEGLMSLFFLLVGLELKREFLDGELAKPAQILLPAVAALGGMVVPALIFTYFNWGQPTQVGWAIPVATDIAFALGLLSLFAKQIPASLKFFLMALAIFDDIGAILIIAVFYAGTLALTPFLWALGLMAVGFGLRCTQAGLVFYAVLGAGLWFAIYTAGIHPTLAGVLLAGLIPYHRLGHKLQAHLHKGVVFLIMPLFALANAGLPLHFDQFLSINPLKLGIIWGLILGKQLGVFSFAALAIRLGLAKLPRGASFTELWAVSWICGIGFTMSLFLGTLAFNSYNRYMSEVRFSVLFGSIVSGVAGALVLYLLSWSKSKRIKHA